MSKQIQVEVFIDIDEAWATATPDWQDVLEEQLGEIIKDIGVITKFERV